MFDQRAFGFFVIVILSWKPNQLKKGLNLYHSQNMGAKKPSILKQLINILLQSQIAGVNPFLNQYFNVLFLMYANKTTGPFNWNCNISNWTTTCFYFEISIN